MANGIPDDRLQPKFPTGNIYILETPPLPATNFPAGAGALDILDKSVAPYNYSVVL